MMLETMSSRQVVQSSHGAAVCAGVTAAACTSSFRITCSLRARVKCKSYSARGWGADDLCYLFRICCREKQCVPHHLCSIEHLRPGKADKFHNRFH
eukprot:441099-Amphidinium_carterae.1